VLAAVASLRSLSSYDAEFLALAQQLGCRVVTQDSDFIRGAARIDRGRVVSLVEAAQTG
jgi:predicted nucleic acid-binding protein